MTEYWSVGVLEYVKSAIRPIIPILHCSITPWPRPWITGLVAYSKLKRQGRPIGAKPLNSLLVYKIGCVPVSFKIPQKQEEPKYVM